MAAEGPPASVGAEGGEPVAHDVFISHSSGDKVTADATVAALEAEGIRCWVAPRDVVPGVQWANAIVQAITECRLMVLVFSSEANDSQHIVREVELAAHHRKPIIPLRVEDAAPSPTLDYYIAGTHWLDAMVPPLEAHLERLSTVVKEMLEAPVAEGSPARAEPVALGPATSLSSSGSPRDGVPGGVAILAPHAPTPTPEIQTTSEPTGVEVPAVLPAAPPPPPSATMPVSLPPPTEPGRRRTGLIALLLALVLLGVGGAAAALLRGGDEDTAEPVSPSASAVVEPPSPSGVSGQTGSTVEVVRAPQHVRTGGVSTDVVRLRWDPAPFGGDVDHFLVMRDGEVIAEVTEGAYADTDVDPAQTYRYTIVAVGADGAEAPSKELEVTTESLPVVPSPDTGTDGGGGGAPPQPPPPEETCSAIDHFEGKC